MTIDNLVIQYLKRELPKIDMKFSYINRGGCGLFALYLYDALESIGIETKIRLMNGPFGVLLSDDELNSCESMHDIHSRDGSVGHIVLQFNEWYIDSTGAATDADELIGMCTLTNNLMSRTTLKNICIDPDGWNDQFNRDQCHEIELEVKLMVRRLSNKIKEFNYLYVRGIEINEAELLAA